jgi:hypothetical protein
MILIEVIESYCNDMLGSEIVQKFDIAKRSTIYNQTQYRIGTKIDRSKREVIFDMIISD